MATEAKFKTMQEAKAWAISNSKRINELDCPKFDIEKPTEADLTECEDICINHWGCHTWRHLRGTRPLKEDKFFIECKICGHKEEAKNAIVAVDWAGIEWNTPYRYVTVQCSACKIKETIDKTSIW